MCWLKNKQTQTHLSQSWCTVLNKVIINQSQVVWLIVWKGVEGSEFL